MLAVLAVLFAMSSQPTKSEQLPLVEIGGGTANRVNWTELPKAEPVTYEVASVDVQQRPSDGVCVNGQCNSTRFEKHVVRERTVTAVQAPSSGSCGSCDPLRNGLQAAGGVARAIGYRITHPFGGRFRCR